MTNLKKAKLYCILPENVDHESLAKQVCLAGIDILQLRLKNKSVKEILDIAKRIRKITKDYNVKFILNDRLDLAIVAEADGVHFGQEDFLLESIPTLYKKFALPKDFMIGISTHSIEEAIESERFNPTYISFGPIFRSPTKPELTPVGVELLREVTSKLKTPVFAIGGITLENIKEIIELDISGVVVVSGIFSSENILETALRFKVALGGIN